MEDSHRSPLLVVLAAYPPAHTHLLARPHALVLQSMPTHQLACPPVHLCVRAIYRSSNMATCAIWPLVQNRACALLLPQVDYWRVHPHIRWCLVSELWAGFRSQPGNRLLRRVSSTPPPQQYRFSLNVYRFLTHWKYKKPKNTCPLYSKRGKSFE